LIEGRTVKTVMKCRNPIRVRNGGSDPLIVIVEPWASEFVLMHGADLDVVATHPDIFPTLEIESLDGRLVVIINQGGSLYEVWRDGVQIG